MKHVLFVGVENANRSQLAQAFAGLHGAGRVLAYSAGSQPAGVINPKALAAMRELGYDLSLHSSKSLEEVPPGPYDAVVTLGCGEACPAAPARLREDWQIPDPKHLGPDEFRKVRDLIESKVKDLLARL